MASSTTIRIYLADGTATGIRIAEILNWTGQGIACPRNRFSELKAWPEPEVVRRPGVYFLFGEDENTNLPAVYIGESESVLNRISSHVEQKDFWNEAILITNKDDNLTKAHVKYLESRLISLAKSAGRYSIQNLTIPEQPTLPRPDREWMDAFVGGVRTILGILGYRLLESLIPATNRGPLAPPPTGVVESIPEQSPRELELRLAGITARAIATDEGLVVRAGSEVARQTMGSLSTALVGLRAQLRAAGVLVESGDNLVFSQDYPFSSPSKAAAFIVGYSINGRLAWKTPGGRTIADLDSDLADSIDIEIDLDGASAISMPVPPGSGPATGDSQSKEPFCISDYGSSEELGRAAESVQRAMVDKLPPELRSLPLWKLVQDKHLPSLGDIEKGLLIRTPYD